MSLTEEQKAELRILAGQMVRDGIKGEMRIAAQALGLAMRRRTQGSEDAASFEFLADTLQAALERALEEPTGDLRTGAAKSRILDPEYQEYLSEQEEGSA